MPHLFGCQGDNTRINGAQENKEKGKKGQANYTSLIYYHIGVVSEAKGERAEAEKSLKKAMDLGLEKPYRKDAERILEEISHGQKQKTDGRRPTADKGL